RGGGRRALRVGALATLSRNFQMQFLRPLIGRRDVEVVLRSGSQPELLRGLESMALDVVLTNLAPARDAASRYLIQRIDEQPVSLIGTPDRLGPTPRPLPALLSDMPLILPTPETALRAGFDALTARLGISPQIAAEADDMAMLRLLVREDAGLAVIPPIVVRDELHTGRLTEAARLDGITETFLAVTLERRFPNPLLTELLH
ncbi:LysR substrate-binding domain-containing protein, partial [uncultured Roseovarius sp.]|uniref:LysR substrate-binding domain-containing protein n=1 Tax=uncultured Roseovarius sp. TaxID=293344 RepID=UPI00263140BE